jgi:uncharacterized membrane protein YvbJ
MFCTNCGNKIEDGNEFCNNCGIASGDKSNSQTSVESVKDSRDIIKKFLKFCLWVAVIIGGISLIIALGPLWIIAIILLLIFFVLANR